MANVAQQVGGIQSVISGTDWFIVKGTTGSGKTFFVEMIKLTIAANKYPVVYVPQFPIFKPQLKVAQFVKMLPLSAKGRDHLFDLLSQMSVATKGLVGGKMMGMLELPGLSGGDRKKLLLATALAMAKEFQCPFVVLDEPFAGIDESSMAMVLRVMSEAQASVSGLTYIIVTHDYLETLSANGKILVVDNRIVTATADGIYGGNGIMGQSIAMALLRSATAVPKARPFFHFYIVKRHFIEQEFVQPLFAGVLFGCLLGSVVVNYAGGLPGLNKDSTYIFMKVFMYDYPNFGSLLNFCFKRAQHMEDFYLNITANEFPLLETLVIVLIQGALLVAVCNACLCGISSFWWISWDAILLDYAFVIFDTFGFLMIPIVFPNPMIANFALLPYAVAVILLNGILLQQEYFWPGVKWMPFLSPSFHLGCAYTHVTDKIALASSDCKDLAVHVIFMNPFAYIIFFLVLLKMIMGMRSRAKLRISASGIAPDLLGKAQLADGTTSEPQEEENQPPALDASKAASKEAKHTFETNDMNQWVANTTWWVVKGPTGSGKTYFVEQLMSGLSTSGRDFVFVPQYPMFKPQLPVMRFLRLLPISKEVLNELLKSLAEMAVPTNGLVGGALYGMLNLPGLSGGQRKKLLVAVSVAIATHFKCQYIIMDEPFAGINKESMKAVFGVLKKAEAVVPGIKFIVVTHDHFDMLSGSSSILHAVDRKIIAENGFDKSNVEAAELFQETLASCASSKASTRPMIDTYVIKRYFVEQEFVFPLFAYILFAILLGLVVMEYEGGLPGIGYDAIYVFTKGFAIEFPHFSGVVNYCFKRGQHLEDYYLGITKTKNSVTELVIISCIQAGFLMPIFTAILCGVSNFWWVNVKVALVDLYYLSVSTVGYFLLPILCPNPIVAIMSILPYVCVWGFTNGVLFPKDDIWDGTRWTATLSPLYNIACAYKEVGEGKLVFRGTECLDSLGLHMFLAGIFTWCVMLGCLIKVVLGKRKRK